MGSGDDGAASGAKSEGREGNGIGDGNEAIARATWETIRNICIFGQWV